MVCLAPPHPVRCRPCHFERGTEAEIIRVLTDPSLVTVEVVPEWTTKKLLRLVARAGTRYGALIDTGALVTGMANEAVARFLLDEGLQGFDACVFLDNRDRQMCVFRGERAAVPLASSGIAVDRRFTFYDQIHTTGIDIAQAPAAKACITLSKDMTLRDYAQGSWRMRGLINGQTLHVLYGPEIQELILKASGSSLANAEVAHGTREELHEIVAWLLGNSVASERLQRVQLLQQSIYAIWRKEALSALLRRSADAGLKLDRFGLDIPGTPATKVPISASLAPAVLSHGDTAQARLVMEPAPPGLVGGLTDDERLKRAFDVVRHLEDSQLGEICSEWLAGAGSVTERSVPLMILLLCLW